MSDPWEPFRKHTRARIGLARSGHACSTSELLRFQRAHAQARDAVWQEWPVETLARELNKIGAETLILRSCARDRAEFLKRPDLGRRLLSKAAFDPGDLSFIVSDGLSANAIQCHFLPFWKALNSRLQKAGLVGTPLILVPFGRVAIADEIGERRGSQLSVIFIGERPGLSSTDSLGIYLTYQPKLGKNDAQRNCISNVRPPEGLSYELAADKLMYLIQESLRLKLSGVDLKESSPLLDAAIPQIDPRARIIPATPNKPGDDGQKKTDPA